MSSLRSKAEEPLPRSFDFAKQLAAVPVANLKARAIPDGEPGLTLAIDLNYPAWIRPITRLLGLRGEKKYRLEGLGLELYRFLDGKRNIGDLIEKLMEDHRLSFLEARGLVIQYLGLLMKRGLVAVGVPK
ncbi:MAG: PqqD family protein [Spirochaetes bacterium]|nr:PqqD family protein [Spirochaetota bacterium]